MVYPHVFSEHLYLTHGIPEQSDIVATSPHTKNRTLLMQRNQNFAIICIYISMKGFFLGGKEAKTSNCFQQRRLTGPAKCSCL